MALLAVLVLREKPRTFHRIISSDHRPYRLLFLTVHGKLKPGSSFIRSRRRVVWLDGLLNQNDGGRDERHGSSLLDMIGPNRRNFRLHVSMRPLNVSPQICGARDAAGWVSRSISAMASPRSTLSGIVSIAATLLVRLFKAL